MDMPIYMAFEGRTWFWLDRLRPVRRIQDYFIKKETTRLKELLNRVDNPVDDKDAREAATELRKSFNFTPDGQFDVRYPTRLGNLIDAFERYPERVYGLDASFI